MRVAAWWRPEKPRWWRYGGAPQKPNKTHGGAWWRFNFKHLTEDPSDITGTNAEGRGTLTELSLLGAAGWSGHYNPITTRDPEPKPSVYHTQKLK
jgi:hypothetical protein